MPSLTYTKMIQKYSWTEIEGKCDCGKPFSIEDPDKTRNIPVKVIGQWHLDKALELAAKFNKKVEKPAELFMSTLFEQNKAVYELSTIQLLYSFHLGFAYSLLGIKEVNEELKKHKIPRSEKH